MNATDRHVIVRASALDDLCELSTLAVTRLRDTQSGDPLNDALAGAVAEVRAHAILDPTE